MGAFENEEIRRKLKQAFPKFFVNSDYEIIVYPPRNSYFMLEDCETERDIIAKMIEWLSREASKSVSYQSQKYHLNGINSYLGTSFTQEDMTEIYTYLGNCCKHAKTLKFIDSGYDMAVFREAL